MLSCFCSTTKSVNKSQHLDQNGWPQISSRESQADEGFSIFSWGWPSPMPKNSKNHQTPQKKHQVCCCFPVVSMILVDVCLFNVSLFQFNMWCPFFPASAGSHLPHPCWFSPHFSTELVLNARSPPTWPRRFPQKAWEIYFGSFWALSLKCTKERQKKPKEERWGTK